jgi:hypothetical protein
MREIERVQQLLARVQVTFMGREFKLKVSHDITASDTSKFNPIHEPRVFMQYVYDAPDTKSGEDGSWKGRKWYLSPYMTDDEIIKTAYLAFRTCVEHEVLESFHVDGTAIFNPHVDFEVLLMVANKEVKRSNEHTSGT